MQGYYAVICIMIKTPAGIFKKKEIKSEHLVELDLIGSERAAKVTG